MIFPSRNLKQLISCALGETPADLVVTDTNLVNVCTCEIIESISVAVKAGRIARVGNCQDLIKNAPIVINGKNEFLLPGLIDAHIHLESSMLSPVEFTRVALSHGTTAAVVDPHEMTNVFGEKILHVLAEVLEDLPLRYFIEVPSCVPALPGFETSEEITPEQTKTLLENDRFYALAEMMNYPGVLFRNDDTLQKLEAAMKNNKLIEGHAPRLTDKQLNAYLAAGITSDHESTTEEEAFEKLRLGCKLQVRQGSFAKDLKNLLIPIIEAGIDTRNCLIASDDRNPIDLLEKGHVNNHLRVMKECGVDPIKAVQMCTLNTATHLKIQEDYGSIAPGKVADFTLVDNLELFNVGKTFFSGKLVFSSNDNFYPTLKSLSLPSWALETVSLPDISPKNLNIVSKIQNGITCVNVIKLIHGSLITEKFETELNVTNSVIHPAPERDILPVYVIDRRYNTGNIGKGFITGLGMKNTALASTVAHDSHHLIVTGTSMNLILKAIMKIKEINGGLVVITDKSSDHLSLEFGGLMNLSLTIDEVVNKLKQLQLSVDSKLDDPFMALSFVALPVIPALKITDKGLIDVEQFKLVDVETNSE
ncbi:MAG: adenine deaminase [Candidatus Hodarchaeales archaeon]|jgi:adenine deaminase